MRSSRTAKILGASLCSLYAGCGDVATSKSQSTAAQTATTTSARSSERTSTAISATTLSSTSNSTSTLTTASTDPSATTSTDPTTLRIEQHEIESWGPSCTVSTGEAAARVSVDFLIEPGENRVHLLPGLCAVGSPTQLQLDCTVLPSGKDGSEYQLENTEGSVIISFLQQQPIASTGSVPPNVIYGPSEQVGSLKFSCHDSPITLQLLGATELAPESCSFGWKFNTTLNACREDLGYCASDRPAGAATQQECEAQRP